MKRKVIKLLFKVKLEMFLNRITKYSCVEYSGLSDSVLYLSTSLCTVADRSMRQQKVTVYISSSNMIKQFPEYQYTFTSPPLEKFKQEEWNKTTTSLPIEIPNIRNLFQV